MKKRIISLIGCMLLYISSSQAQIALSFESGIVDSGDDIEIDVSVSDFTDIASLQYSINWNPDVLTFSSVINFNTNLPEFSIGTLNFPGPDSENIDPGFMTFSWSASV